MLEWMDKSSANFWIGFNKETNILEEKECKNQ